MNEDIYLCMSKNGKVKGEHVRVRDIAKVYCTDGSVVNRVKSLTVYDNKMPNGTCVISVLKVVETILKVYPTATVNSIGENDVLVERIKKKRNRVVEKMLITIVCLLVSIGSAFAVMAYNNDVDAKNLFRRVYELVLGTEEPQFKILEISYSAGLFLGIVVFYGHFGKWKFISEPTPLEVEMKLYESDINTAMVEEKTSEGVKIDVD